MSVELVTGYYGVGEGGKPQRHVSSAEDGARQAGTLGPGCYVLSTGSKLSATMEDANTLVVADGDAIMNGRHVRLTETTSFTIPTGVQGQKMSNVAVLRYQVGSDSVESVTPLVLTGEPSTGEPADPEHNEGSILDGDSPVDMPLYRIVTDGINAGDPEPLFDVLMPMADLWDSVSHRSDINLAASDDRLVAWRVGPVVTVSYLRTADGFWSGSPGQYQRLGTMPEGLRPRADCRAFAFATGGAVEYMYVGVDGSVGFTNIGTAGSTMDGFFGCVISYAVAP